MSVKHMKGLLTNADVLRLGGQCHLRAVALWIDAGTKPGFWNARLDQLEELLHYVEFQAVGHEYLNDVLASDYDMVISAHHK